MTQSTDQDAGDPIFDPDVREERRLEALRDYDILGTPPEDAFDRLTRLAADLFGVEVAFVAFLDTDRQWFKSNVGLDRTESTLAASFCTHTIEGDGPLVIEDAANDERTEDRPFVTEAGLHFYAGMPIQTPDEVAIGTFSIMGSEPRSLSDEETRRLADLAEMANEELEHRREARTHEETARRFEAILEDPNMLMGVLGPDGTLLEANETSLQYIEASEDEVLGRPFWETPWWPAAMQDEIRSWVDRAASGEYVEYEADLERPGDTSYSVEGTIRPVTGDEGAADALVVSARDVTERKRREEELRRLSEAIEQATETVFITEAEPLDEPGPRIVYANEAFEEQTGYSKEEVLGKTPRILQGPETERAVLDTVRTALKHGEQWDGETVNYRKDGTPYRVQWNLSPVRGKDGEIEHWVSVQRDVTEERRREEDLRRQKSLLAQAQRLAGAWEADLRSGEVFWSEKVYEIHDLEPGTELELEEVFGFLEPEARPKAREAFEKCAETGEPYDLELPLVTAGGNRRWIRTVGGPAETEGEAVTKVAGALQDITARKRYERELEHYREYTDDILDAVHDVFYILDSEGVLERWNQSFLEMTGYSEEEIASMHGTDFFAEEYAEEIAEAIDETFETGHVVVEAPFQTKGGETVPYEFVATLVEAPDGTEKLAGIGRDITNRKRREQDLQERQQKEEALYTATEQLLKAQTSVEVADRIEEVVRRTFDYPLNGVHFAREGKLVPVRVSPSIAERWSDPPARDLDGDGLGARAYRSGRTTTAADLSTFDTMIDYKDLGAGACVPIGDHGVISIASTEVDDIDLFDVRLLEILAADAAAVLDRIEYEEKLERQNDLFAQAQKIAQVGGWEYNIRRDESSLTDQAYRIHGLPPDADMDPEKSFGFFHPDDRATIRDAFTRAVQEGIPYDLELRLLPEDGDQRWVRTSGEPLVENGEVYCVRGTLQDITERKNRERALRRSEKRWRSLLEHLRSGVHVSAGNIIQYVNPAGAEILGAGSPDDIVGRDPRDFIPDDAEVDVEQRLGTLERGEATAPTEHEIVRADGTRCLIRVYSVPIQINGKQGRQSVFRDVTERKRREERLRDRRRKIESLYDATKSLLTAERLETVYERIHNVITKVFDYSLSNTGFVDGEKLIPVEMSTDDSEGVPSPKIRSMNEDSVATRALRTGETVVVEDVHALDSHIDYGTLQSVAVIPIARHGVIVLGQVGEREFASFNLRLLEILGTYASMVLDRLHGEKALREAKEEAEKASRLKSAMLANMSHEIRTPLTSVTGFAELLKEHLEGQMETFAEQIYNGSMRLQKTLDSVLQLSRLEAGVYEMERTSLSLSPLMEDTVDMLRLSAEEKGLRLNVELPDGPVEGAFNEGAVNRILENLLENAIKFTPEGGTIEVRARTDGDDAVLEVEDTGVGISEEALPEIFGAFQQESAGKAREYEGSGLGLSIVKRLAEAHGGTVDVDSKKGVGTRFTVRLPRSTPADDE